MEKYSSLSEEYLLLEIKAGNMLAFDVIYRKYCSRVYKFSVSILKIHEEAENIVQEVFLNLWLNRTRIEKGSSLKYYIFSITYNSSVSVIRQKAREAKYVEYLKNIQCLEYESDDLNMEYNELQQKLDKIVELLPERQRQIYRLHKNEGLKYAEIAKRLNISINTIETHMSRALKNIREKLGESSVLIILFTYLFV